ncbi:hypothetical protein APA_1135 [Pseudanabaena sp. lw0831]|nr:hypothetical protein APA_1135 [Pseudanabaena sp. lw0831]
MSTLSRLFCTTKGDRYDILVLIPIKKIYDIYTNELFPNNLAIYVKNAAEFSL